MSIRLSPKSKKWLKAGLRCLVAAILFGLAGWVFAPNVLVVDSGPHSAEVEVVLGGEPWTRPVRSAEIFKEARPSLVIVSGNGDCDGVRTQMEAKGVPHEVITMECESRSTHENAALTVKLLRERHTTNVVLVTSWYHSRRALACFRQAAPEIQFYIRPTPCPPVGLRHPDSYVMKRVFQEYAKIVYYWVAYGVTP